MSSAVRLRSTLAVQTKRMRCRSTFGSWRDSSRTHPASDLAQGRRCYNSPTMDIERLLREVEKRLGKLDEGVRAEALDGLREELARERRRVTLSLTVETERERR